MQSIPAVYASRTAQSSTASWAPSPSTRCSEFVDALLPTEEEVAVAGCSTRATRAACGWRSIEPANEDVIVALAELLVAEGNSDEALALLARIPESERTRHVAALARVGIAPQDDYDDQLTALLDQVKADDDARQKFVDLLELMGPTDPRTAEYRHQLTSASDLTPVLTPRPTPTIGGVPSRPAAFKNAASRCWKDTTTSA